MCGKLLPTATTKSSVISFCHTSSPYLTHVVFPGPVESSYDDHINLIDLHTSSKAPATLLLPPVRPFHHSGNPSTSCQPPLGHLYLPISPTATGPATSLLLIRRHLVSNSSHSIDYGSRDEPDPSQLLLPGNSLYLPLGQSSLPFSAEDTRPPTSSLLTSTHRNSYLFPSH